MDSVPAVDLALDKKQMISAVAKVAQVSADEAENVLSSFSAVLASVMEAGGSMSLPGVGKWECKPTPARFGRNPQTGGSVVIEANRRVSFKASKTLKNSAKI